MKDPMWTLEQGLEVIRRFQFKALQKGYHLGLAGGVLNNGYSHKDLDIVALKMDKTNSLSPKAFADVAEEYLGPIFMSPWQLNPPPSLDGVDKDKLVTFMGPGGKRIDLLFYMARTESEG